MQCYCKIANENRSKTHKCVACSYVILFICYECYEISKTKRGIHSGYYCYLLLTKVAPQYVVVLENFEIKLNFVKFLRRNIN
jgi:hypothetical protein